MIYAFDWGGTLNENPELMELAKALLHGGHEVHIVSVAWEHEKREERVAEYGRDHDLPWTGIHVIIETGHTQHGVEKVEIMKRLGCRVISDDNEDVILRAKEAGFLALHVPYEKEAKTT